MADAPTIFDEWGIASDGARRSDDAQHVAGRVLLGLESEAVPHGERSLFPALQTSHRDEPARNLVGDRGPCAADVRDREWSVVDGFIVVLQKRPSDTSLPLLRNERPVGRPDTSGLLTVLVAQFGVEDLRCVDESRVVEPAIKQDCKHHVLQFVELGVPEWREGSDDDGAPLLPAGLKPSHVRRVPPQQTERKMSVFAGSHEKSLANRVAGALSSPMLSQVPVSRLRAC